MYSTLYACFSHQYVDREPWSGMRYVGAAVGAARAPSRWSEGSEAMAWRALPCARRARTLSIGLEMKLRDQIDASMGKKERRD